MGTFDSLYPAAPGDRLSSVKKSDNLNFEETVVNNLFLDNHSNLLVNTLSGSNESS